MYSASALDLERVGYFLETLVSRFFPRNTQKPVVDRLLSGQPAQSASENAKKVVNGPGVMVRPSQGQENPSDTVKCVLQPGDVRWHELTNLIDGIANVRSGESEVLKGNNNTTRFCCIRERSTIVCREL